ncbi:hypothetical protein [Streptomyces sp. NPDC058486]|uniref:hypothetical protein n=1 Tax=unclassified Streptomyces TaxID=2593676 RepID=UPI00364B68AE
MITQQAPTIPESGSEPDALRYALIPVNGPGIAVATAVWMLDDGQRGTRARILAAGEPLPYGAQPVILAETTVYGASCVEGLLMHWGPLPKPWLVWIADAPARPVPDARYLVRALMDRLAGVARVPYLPVLRTVRGPEDAFAYKDVQAAAEELRRTLEGNR